MTERVPHGVAHVPHGTPEFVGDSKRWIDHVATTGGHWVDLNWIGKYNTHYLYPLLHGFIDPLGRLDKHTPVTKMTYAEVGRLVAEWEGKKYHISTIEENVHYALHRRVGAEVEEKRRQPLTAVNTLYNSLRHENTAKVQIKVGMWLPGRPWTWLEAAHRRFKTIALTHGMRGDDDPKRYATLPTDSEQFIDYYRGWTPHWV